MIQSAADVVTALGKMADLVGAGEVTPDEGAAVARHLREQAQGN